MHKQSLVPLLRWMVLVIATGAIGALASRDAGLFYAQLARPAWAPPAWLFGPVWTALYLMMGVAAWRAERAGASRGVLVLFVVQLAVNALWSWFFFAWRLGGAAFADILVLDALVLATFVAFRRVDRVAGALLVPYMAWIAFATALNWTVWQANPALLR